MDEVRNPSTTDEVRNPSTTTPPKVIITKIKRENSNSNSISSKNLDTVHENVVPFQSVMPNNNVVHQQQLPPTTTPEKPTSGAAVVTPNAAPSSTSWAHGGGARNHDSSTVSNRSMLVDLDMSILDTEASTAAGSARIIPFSKIIEAAMETYHLVHDRESSKLSQVWFASDENKQGGISMQDALEAAVTDMMNLQNLLVTAERKIVDYEAAEVPACEENALQAENASMQVELDASKTLVDQHVHQKQRIIANLKKNKALMDTLTSKLSVCENDLASLSAENTTLRQNLLAVTELRDSYKNKLRGQQEGVKESRAIIQDLEKRLRKTEQARVLECELLDNFRKLAIHTG